MLGLFHHDYVEVMFLLAHHDVYSDFGAIQENKLHSVFF